MLISASPVQCIKKLSGSNYYLAISSYSNGSIYKIDASSLTYSATNDTDMPLVKSSTALTSSYYYDFVQVGSSTNVLIGENLVYIYNYATNSVTKTSAAAANFFYADCIDSSTCISARYFNSPSFYRYTTANFLGSQTTFETVNFYTTIAGETMGLRCIGSVATCLMTTTVAVYVVNPTSMVNILSSMTMNTTFSTMRAYTSTGKFVVGNYTSADKTFRFYEAKTSGYNNGLNLLGLLNLTGTGVVRSTQSISSDGKYLAVADRINSKVYVYERKPCHSSCATCSGPLDTDCIACVSGLPLLDGLCACSGNCLACETGSFKRCSSCD